MATPRSERTAPAAAADVVAAVDASALRSPAGALLCAANRPRIVSSPSPESGTGRQQSPTPLCSRRCAPGAPRPPTGCGRVLDARRTPPTPGRLAAAAAPPPPLPLPVGTCLRGRASELPTRLLPLPVGTSLHGRSSELHTKPTSLAPCTSTTRVLTAIHAAGWRQRPSAAIRRAGKAWWLCSRQQRSSGWWRCR